MRIYTRKGDDGTTGLHYGGRARKNSVRVQVTGAVDEAQAAIGVARAVPVLPIGVPLTWSGRGVQVQVAP
jgi:cob(I)alamin adenosyltransferase